jgi:hypothetical protein
MQKTNKRVIQRLSLSKPDLPGVYQTLALDPGLMSEVISQTQCGPGRHSETSVKKYDRRSATRSIRATTVRSLQCTYE